MIQRSLYPFLLLCFIGFYGATAYGQASKSYSILQAEPVFDPNNLQIAFGGMNFTTLSDVLWEKCPCPRG
jgi:hypothetical protein